jgi:TAP-like protein
MPNTTARPARTARAASLVLIVCLLAATIPGCSSQAPTDRAPAAAPLRWGSCAETALAFGQCATLTVPLDHHDPAAGTIELFVFRIPARATSRGVLFTNPGGPGASGVDWPDLGHALFAAQHGDGRPLAELSPLWRDRAQGSDLANQSAPDAVYCADHPQRDTLDAASPDKAAIDAAAPAFAPYLRVVVPRCHGYPAPREPIPSPNAGSTRILVVAATGDVATPYAGAQNLARALGPNATLLTREGDGHTSYGFDLCTNDIVDRFLQDPATPPRATRCS